MFERRRNARLSNFGYFCSLNDGFALLHLFGHLFDCTFGNMAPLWIQALLLREQLDLLLGLGCAFKTPSSGLGSTCPLRAGDFALLPLTATSVVCSVVGVAVSTPFLLLCHGTLTV